MRPFKHTAILATLLGACCGAALAQQQPNNPAPANVGVSPSTAADAQQQAVPRSDVGTVVRTGPSAADRARAATSRGDATPSDTPGTTRDASTSSTASSARPPIADRN